MPANLTVVGRAAMFAQEMLFKQLALHVWPLGVQGKHMPGHEGNFLKHDRHFNGMRWAFTPGEWAMAGYQHCRNKIFSPTAKGG